MCPQAQDKRWREFFENRWGQPNALMERAAELAGSYRSLYAAKHVMDRDAMPWIKPTGFELGAAVENIAVTGMGLAPPPKGSDPCLDWSPPVAAEMDGEERSLLFLVDGSGSVTEGERALALPSLLHAPRSRRIGLLASRRKTVAVLP